MKKLGCQAQQVLDRNEHPLTRSAMIDLASSLVWDGDNEGALALVKVLVGSILATRDREDFDRHADFYQLLGMRATLSAVVGHLQHKREDRAERRLYPHRYRTKSTRRVATTATAAKRTA